jgi:hypothetical protein
MNDNDNNKEKELFIDLTEDIKRKQKYFRRMEEVKNEKVEQSDGTPEEYVKYEYYETIWGNVVAYPGNPIKQEGTGGPSPYALKSSDMLKNSKDGFFSKIKYE